MSRNADADAEVFHASLSQEEVLARCQAAASRNDAGMKVRKLNGKRDGGTAHVVQKSYDAPVHNEARDFKAGRRLAERLILEKGGRLRPLPSYEQYFHEYEAAKHDVEATA